MHGQIELLDYLDRFTIKEPAIAEFSKGDTVYKLVLDVVEIGVIEHIWECNGGYGYSAKKDSGCFLTFWTYNIGDTVFSDKTMAYEKAKSLRNTFKVIRASELHTIKERNFVRPTFDNRVLLSATVKLLENNMVYYKTWMCYPFLEFSKTPSEAEKLYKDELNKILYEVDGKKAFEVSITDEIKDMYLSQTKLWSNYDYAEFNRPVLMIPNNN